MLTFHQTNIYSRLIEVLFKQWVVGKQSTWFYDVELEGNIIWMLLLVNIYLIFIDDYFAWDKRFWFVQTAHWD